MLKFTATLAEKVIRLKFIEMIDQYAKCLILLILLGAGACFAATPFTPRHPDPVHESWRWRSFLELKGQGLSCLAQDGDGNFLFGTDDGIYRYDGMSWHLFPFDEGMERARTNALYVARDGSVYVGSDRGICRFVNGIWERVFPSEGEWNTYDLMEAQDGSLWAGTEWGALRLTAEGARLYVASEDTMGIRQRVSDAVTVPDRVLHNRRLMVYSLCEAPNGAIWGRTMAILFGLILDQTSAAGGVSMGKMGSIRARSPICV